MTYEYRCVINKKNRYQTYVLVLLETNEKGQTEENIQGYSLKNGESLINELPPKLKIYPSADGFIIPAWDGSKWIEKATEEEITEWEQEHPAPEKPSEPSSEERIAMLEAQITEAQIALCQIYEELGEIRP